MQYINVIMSCIWVDLFTSSQEILFTDCNTIIFNKYFTSVFLYFPCHG